MATRWHVEETRRLVQEIFGRKQRELAAPSLRSADDHLSFARVQYKHFEQRQKAYLRKQRRGFSVLQLAVDGDEEGWQEFNIFLLQVGAYITACIWNMHTLPDTLAHAVFYSLGDAVGPAFANERSINAKTVAARLRDVGRTRLADLLDELRSSGEFAHLEALSNHAKHRSLIPPGLNENFTGRGKHKRFAVTLQSFTYDGKQYPRVIVTEFLPPEYARLSRVHVAIGNELTAALKQLAADRRINV
jgi:hypothetical protein